MKDCDKIYMVFYLGVGDRDEISISSIVGEAIQYYGGYFDDSVKPFFIPVRGTDYTRVEVLNPRHVSKGEFKRTLNDIRKTCKKLRAKFDDIKNNTRNTYLL